MVRPVRNQADVRWCVFYVLISDVCVCVYIRRRSVTKAIHNIFDPINAARARSSHNIVVRYTPKHDDGDALRFVGRNEDDIPNDG